MEVAHSAQHRRNWPGQQLQPAAAEPTAGPRLASSPATAPAGEGELARHCMPRNSPATAAIWVLVQNSVVAMIGWRWPGPVGPARCSGAGGGPVEVLGGQPQEPDPEDALVTTPELADLRST